MNHKFELLFDDISIAELDQKMKQCLSSQIRDGDVEIGSQIPVLKLGGAEQVLIAIVSSSALTAFISGVISLIRRPSKIVLESFDGTKVSIEADRVDMKQINELAKIANKLRSASLRVESTNTKGNQE